VNAEGPKECPVIPPGKLIVDISVGGVEDRAALPFFSDVPPAPCIWRGSSARQGRSPGSHELRIGRSVGHILGRMAPV
jgi:hypothetical protein